MISDVIPCLGFFPGTSDSDSFSGAVQASSLLGLRTSRPLIATKQNLQDVEHTPQVLGVDSISTLPGIKTYEDN